MLAKTIGNFSLGHSLSGLTTIFNTIVDSVAGDCHTLLRDFILVGVGLSERDSIVDSDSTLIFVGLYSTHDEGSSFHRAIFFSNVSLEAHGVTLDSSVLDASSSDRADFHLLTDSCLNVNLVTVRPLDELRELSKVVFGEVSNSFSRRSDSDPSAVALTLYGETISSNLLVVVMIVISVDSAQDVLNGVTIVGLVVPLLEISSVVLSIRGRVVLGLGTKSVQHIHSV
jgi:hypothetical protein